MVRTLAVPSTEDPTSPVNWKRKIEDEYLVEALELIADTMGDLTVDRKTALQAAIWVAEMVMGKPKQPIDNEAAAGQEVARILAETLKSVIDSVAPPPPIIEGNVRILGEALSEPDANRIP